MHDPTAPSTDRSVIASVNYERPIPARLDVRLEDGTTWPATIADADRFGFVDAKAAQTRVNDLFDRLRLTDQRFDYLAWGIERAIAGLPVELDGRDVGSPPDPHATAVDELRAIAGTMLWAVERMSEAPARMRAAFQAADITVATDAQVVDAVNAFLHYKPADQADDEGVTPA